MKIAIMPYTSSATKRYWTGMNTKKAHANVPWSETRVGDNVTNSRKAKNEVAPKSTTDPTPPVRSVSASTAHMAHHAFMRARRLSVSARPVSLVKRRERIATMTELMVSRPSTPDRT